MNGIPKDIDKTLLLGATLTQVCVGQNEVILHFSNDTSVTIESELGVGVADNPTLWTAEATQSGVSLIALLGADVTHVEVLSSTQLEIRLHPDARIILCDSSPHYESFSIQNGARRIIV